MFHSDKKKRSFRKSKDWFDKDLLKLIKGKDKFVKKYIPKKSTIVKAKCKEARNKYFYSIQEKKKVFFVSILEKQEHNIEMTWQTVNILLGKTKNHSCTSLNIHGGLSTDDAKIATTSINTSQRFVVT